MAIVGFNRTPFLINVPGQWQYRPGAHAQGQSVAPSGDFESAPRNSVTYHISNKRWVVAGTFMATTTRLTTMEAANESARHAVNAILDRLLSENGNDYNAQGKMFADFAEIWDPEKNELDDLEPLKRLDRKLLQEGLPHVLDILKIIEAVDTLPMHGQLSADGVTNLLQLLQKGGQAFGRDFGFVKDAIHGMFAQAATAAASGGDPFGILGRLKSAPLDVAERLQRAIRTFMEQPGQDSGQKGGGTGGTGS
jgi:hypothetical protein